MTMHGQATERKTAGERNEAGRTGGVASAPPAPVHATGQGRAAPRGVDGFRYHRVEKRIMRMIDSGEYPPGERLPSLRSLSLAMSVSIATATHAYMELERKGVIEARPRSGYFVRARFRRLPTPASPSAQLSEPQVVNRGELIRTVLHTVGNTDILPFGVASPARELLPVKALGRIMAQVVKDRPGRALDYEIIPGSPELRRQIAFRSMDTGADVGPQDLLITTGCMEALYIALRCVTRPGDNVLIQSPSYYCFLQLLETLGLRAIEIPSHPEAGVSPRDLHEALDTYDIQACILTPNFNNPDGALTPGEARREIVRMLARRDIPLVEDDVYGELHFGPRRPGVCKRYDDKGLVILCSSFSKTLSPGYRVGWMAPGRFMDKALDIKATTSVCSATPTQMAVAEYLRQGHFDRHLKRLRSAIERQMQMVQAQLAASFPAGLRVTRPHGGLVLWLELPERVDAVRLFFKAKAEGVGIAPGPIFSTQEKFGHFIRISCNGLWDDRTRDGLARLGQLVAAWA
ncbi:MAG: PLP-dependent aminotransferase family protein [Desulfovibrionaceae bacterium]